MNYVELNIPVSDPLEAEMLIAELAEWPFESFQEETGALKAYIPSDALPKVKETVDSLLAAREITGARYIEIETQNWNAVWEAQFEPVAVDERLVIRAPFHSPAVGDVREIIIMPKMSFGTGHHATTWLMSAEMLDHDFAGRRVLDMGSGTGVLAILAAKLGAESVMAVDIDEWAYTNSLENISLNGVAEVVTSIRGDAAAIRGQHFDVVLANINRNILLADMPAYVATLSEQGELIVSGIFETDIEAIERRAVELGLWPSGQRVKDGWAALSFRTKSHV
ncbi:MAG: 50S ribosomal protein L11 methyltransferase [Alistipes sp.]|jgi:ribosomal protein L11 methyltransferase|nr:50S ribosomal protein L11 methyltransferase [Alistipes sp.]